VGRHYVQVFAFEAFSRGLFALANILLVRLLSPPELSTLTVAMAVVVTVSQTLGSAVNRIYVLTRVDADDVAVGRRLLGAELLGTAAIAVLAFPARGALNGTYVAVGLLSLATTATEFGKAYYQRRLNFLAFSTAELARTIFVLAAIAVMAALNRLSAEGMLLAQGAATAGVAVTMLARIRMLRPAPIAASMRLLLDLFRHDQRYVVGYSILMTILPSVQPIVLRATSSDMVLATYGSAFRYYSVLLLALNAAHVVLLPSLNAARDAAEMRGLLRTHARVSVAFAGGVAAVAVASTWIIPIIDGGKYPQAIATFHVLCASSAISFALSPRVNVLLVRNGYRELFLVTGTTLACSVASSLALARSFGAVGAAIAALLANAFFNVWVAVRAGHILRVRDGA
jgi:O-antigen/teichoic acid export membrane protein